VKQLFFESYKYETIIIFGNLQVYADGYGPREIEFAVVEQHPTLLNVTLHPSKVGQRRRRPETPPWLGGSGGGSGGGAGVLVVQKTPSSNNPSSKSSNTGSIGGNRGDIGDSTGGGEGGSTLVLDNNNSNKQVTSTTSQHASDVQPYTFFNPGTFSVTYPPHQYNTSQAPVAGLLAAGTVKHALVGVIILLALY
jgi:hypothetical protein